MTLGDFIHKYRKENKLSMDEFAIKSGLSKAYVGLLEKNKHPKTGKEITPSIDIIKKVADAIGMGFDELFNSIDSTTKIIVGTNVSIDTAVSTNKFSSQLKQLRTEKELSQQELANIIGVSKSSINMYERGEREPGLETLETIANYFNVDMDYLMGRQEAPRKIALTTVSKSTLPADAIPYEPVPMVLIPLVGVVNCGIPLFAEDNIEEQIPTPAAEVLTGETYFWLRAKGDSMRNIGIHDGDLLFIRQQSDVDSGDIAVVSINGDDATLKRIIKKENSLVLQPENPSHETKIYVGSEVDNICIRGRLMKVEKRF